jgi:hypothetical protein
MENRERHPGGGGPAGEILRGRFDGFDSLGWGCFSEAIHRVI